MLLVATVAVLAVVVLSLPASLLRRLLPPGLTAADFSGTLWHGSAGSVLLNGRSLGAVEWRLHPGSLLGLALTADLHWVKVGFVADGTVQLSSQGLIARNAEGGGPIEDLHDVGVAQTWRGLTNFKLGVLQLAFPQSPNGSVNLVAVSGDLNLTDVSSTQVANGADLGGYTLHMADPKLAPGSDASAELTDNGGPLALHATIRLTADGHTGMLSGTIKARADAPQALRREVDTLAELHLPDAQGNIPVDLEFTL